MFCSRIWGAVVSVAHTLLYALAAILQVTEPVPLELSDFYLSWKDAFFVVVVLQTLAHISH